MYLCQVIILVLGRLRQEGQPGLYSEVEVEVRVLWAKGQPGLHSEVKVEVRGLGVKGQPGLYSEVPSQNKTSNNKKPNTQNKPNKTICRKLLIIQMPYFIFKGNPKWPLTPPCTRLSLKGKGQRQKAVALDRSTQRGWTHSVNKVSQQQVIWGFPISEYCACKERREAC